MNEQTARWMRKTLGIGAHESAVTVEREKQRADVAEERAKVERRRIAREKAAGTVKFVR